MVLKELVHGEGGCADRTFVREVRRFQTESMVLHNVAEQFPLVNLLDEISSLKINNHV